MYIKNINLMVSLKQLLILNEAKQIASTGKVPVYRIPAVPIDYITSYRFYRKIGERNMVVTGEFTYKDAIVAGCFDTLPNRCYENGRICQE